MWPGIHTVQAYPLSMRNMARFSKQRKVNVRGREVHDERQHPDFRILEAGWGDHDER
jgi:hypothetical protein